MCVRPKGADDLTYVRSCAYSPHMARPLAQTDLAHWLADQIAAKKTEQESYGIRTLARAMNPGEPELARRMLNRVLYDGSWPNSAYRKSIADGLGIAVSEVPASPAPFRKAA